jgi:hypothetical protein
MILVWWEGGVRAGPKECSVWLLQHGPAEVAGYMGLILNGPPSTSGGHSRGNVADCHNLQSSYGRPRKEQKQSRQIHWRRFLLNEC